MKLKEKLLNTCCKENDFLDKYVELIEKNLNTKKEKWCTQSHHILPKSVGGTNDEDNLVNLKYSDHILAHYYLCLCCKDSFKRGLYYAFFRMSKQENIDNLERKDYIYSEYLKINSSSKIGRKLSEETKRKISESLSGSKNHNFGKKKSEETKRKISESKRKNHPMLGKKLPEYWRTKISKGNKGKHSSPRSEKVKTKISKSLLGNKNHLGKKHSKQTIIKMSKPVAQFTLDGTFVRNFIGMSEANRISNISLGNIVSCCKGKRKTAGGYIWKYI